jgi:Family of unknown function (DUF6496)
MAEHALIARARQEAREGKSPSTQAGEFVREEFHHIREGIHGAQSAKQAIAIGLSKARRAGVRLPPPRRGKVSGKVRNQAARDYKKGQTHGAKKPAVRRSRAVLRALRHEGRKAASPLAISRQAHRSARNRTAAERSAAARKAVRTRSRIQ